MKANELGKSIESLKYLMEGLKVNKTITTLDLSGTIDLKHNTSILTFCGRELPWKID